MVIIILSCQKLLFHIYLGVIILGKKGFLPLRQLTLSKTNTEIIKKKPAIYRQAFL